MILSQSVEAVGIDRPYCKGCVTSLMLMRYEQRRDPYATYDAARALAKAYDEVVRAMNIG